MPIDENGRWSPNASPKQNLLREMCKKFKFVLANGPRYSGKTIGAYLCICDHAWSVAPANICMISISQTVGLDAGTWKDLTKVIIPDWISGNFGFEWVLEPYIQGVSKKPTCEVTNYLSLNVNTEGMGKEERIKALRNAGATTEIQLESLKVEEEVEERFKPRRYSLIYVAELSSFHYRKTFNTWTECLRVIGLPEDKHCFLADSNPPDDTSWWMHDLWWDLLEANEAELDPEDYGFEKDMPDALENLLELKHSLCRVDINIDENPFADPKHVRLLKSKYAENQEMYRRYILGECVQTTDGSVFHEVFRPGYHIVGEYESAGNKDPIMMFPEPDCYWLLTGWDPGPVNCAACVLEPVVTHLPQYQGKTLFKLLDEHVIVGHDVHLKDFVRSMLDKMDYWENACGRKVRWEHWSDRSVFDMRDMESQKFYQQLVYEFSEGRINLMAAERGPGSLDAGINLIRRLLWEGRLFIQASRCPAAIAMFKGIKRKKGQTTGVRPDDKHKHPLDMLRYPISKVLYEELNRSVMGSLRKKSESSLVSIPA